MDENLRETTELPESGGTAPNEENEPETKSIRFVPVSYTHLTLPTNSRV